MQETTLTSGRPDWDDARMFLAIARAGQMLGASRTLGVNQATLSRRMAALEVALGAKLLQGKPDRFRPALFAGVDGNPQSVLPGHREGCLEFAAERVFLFIAGQGDTNGPRGGRPADRVDESLDQRHRKIPPQAQDAVAVEAPLGFSLLLPNRHGQERLIRRQAGLQPALQIEVELHVDRPAGRGFRQHFPHGRGQVIRGVIGAQAGRYPHIRAV